ncbi:unnamed protein product [Cuscuta epithymum]|uniref:Leucine-rich repeat-containing N-terminal plant-type domain-containing protein n=1 Tax=Cuscuta epithymum TaxID=186058 RepID=A0AAV0F2W3_9ASTE|nr:unnamed protein product [Cuscuta epithymum]
MRGSLTSNLSSSKITENWKKLRMGRLLLHSCTEIAIAVGVSCLLLVMSVGSVAVRVSTTSKCIDGERQALLKFKHNILDEYEYLSSWGNHDENCCCGWAGVGCDNLTGHVIKLDLSGMDLRAKGGMYNTQWRIQKLCLLGA